MKCLGLKGLGLLQRTRELILKILIIFVAEPVGGDVGAGFGVSNILHLVGVLLDTNLA